MLFVVIPLLVIRSLIAVISDGFAVTILRGDILNDSTYTSYFNSSWAAWFIYAIGTSAIFLGVALIALLRPEQSVPREKQIGYDHPHVTEQV